MATVQPFVEARLPTAVSFASVGGPEFLTSILVLGSGYEHRVINWERARARYNIAYGIRTPAQLAEVINFFRAVRGQAIGFRYKDFSDFTAVNPAFPTLTTMPLGVGDGETDTAQLTKLYDLGGGATYYRQIKKPVAGTVHLFADGEEIAGWSLDPTTGIVTFEEAPAEGVDLSWTGEFDVPCRFGSDRLQTNFEMYKIGNVEAIDVLEIRV